MTNLEASESAWKFYRDSPFYWRHGIPKDKEHVSFEIFLAGWTACLDQVLDILAKAPRNNPNLMSTFQMDQQSEVEKQIKSL